MQNNLDKKEDYISITKENKKSKGLVISIIVLLFLIIISIVIVGGNHMNNKNMYSTKSQIQTAKELLKNKYDEDFEVSAIGSRYGTLSNSSYKVICHPVNHPELIFEAEISKDGSYIYDEYISKIVCNELTNNITQKVNFNAEFYIESRPDVFETTNKNISLNELVSLNENTDFVIWMVCNNEDISSILKKLNEVFSSYSNLNGEIRYYATDDDTIVKKFGEIAKESTTFTSDMTMLLADIDEQNIRFNKGKIDQ